MIVNYEVSATSPLTTTESSVAPALAHPFVSMLGSGPQPKPPSQGSHPNFPPSLPQPWPPESHGGRSLPGLAPSTIASGNILGTWWIL